ncbi:MAG: threonine ammonia-lyase [Gammaproteobacteria bacterium]|nr:threonine ammonia-lyase [Gammaproteobacteria bacterium]MCP5425826.1 threonine ammonia-lyase [Gammaproteobacteria bacterium]MCP5458564.1 threonine ammonia-lyase [Gammaproteobacteria bacterium]
MVSLADIQAARERIAAHVYLSPCAYTETLSRMTGCRVYLKLENLQMTGSFKERGALNKILSLNAEQKAAGIVAASAGNHAQGVAHAARIQGIKAVIVMPETTPLAKIRGTQAFGAEIILHGGSYDEAFAKASELRDRWGYTFIHAFDDPAVIAGQGTIGLELLEQVPDLDVLLVPVGGGGLIAGIATAVKATRPEIRVIGVETESLPAMQASLAFGHVHPLPAASTLAEGIAVAVVGAHTYPIVERHVERIVTVSEEEIANAILVLLEQEKTLAEGAGAVGFAALAQHRVADVQGRKVGVILSGGNIDMSLLSRIIARGLEVDGRLARISVVVPDKPGSAAELTAIIAEQRANIFDLAQSRPLNDVQLGQAEVAFTLETKGREHVQDIIRAIERKGYVVTGADRGPR